MLFHVKVGLAGQDNAATEDVFSNQEVVFGARSTVPKIFEWNGYKFFFFSNEGTPLEPCHVHIRRGEKRAKFWVKPVVGLAESYEMHSSELTALERIVEENRESDRKEMA